MQRSMPDWGKFLAHSQGERLPSPVTASISGKTVVVTGAGGSIGSDLVKALASAKPRHLVLLDSSEGNLFQIQQYIEQAHPALSCPAVLGSIEDEVLLDDVFQRFSPDIVFHAAAYKHVALLERNPFSAIRNNALGTYTLVKAAHRHDVSKLVLISTDKAVCPHSVMGVSKRIAELITMALSGPACRMNAIRLCNVIGSSGSVVPIFWEQIQKAQPLTVTHPEASRYFLSRAEAVRAILAAGDVECGGCILLPELDTPVRIKELARFLGGNSPIHFVGLRPGEKLSEDLVAPHETRAGTIDGCLILIKTHRPSMMDIDEAVQRLAACVADRNVPELLEVLLSLVPEYGPSQLVSEGAALVSGR